jgi:hypothetical protein
MTYKFMQQSNMISETNMICFYNVSCIYANAFKSFTEHRMTFHNLAQIQNVYNSI